MIRLLTELLAILDLQVRQAEHQITRQLAIIELLERAGRDAIEAKELLLTFRDTLESQTKHRDRVRADIARLARPGD